MNGNGELSHAEEHIFQMELFQYVRCKAFFDHIIEVIDSNDNGKISEEEWYQFFEMEHTSAGMNTKMLPLNMPNSIHSKMSEHTLWYQACSHQPDYSLAIPIMGKHWYC